nr:hypothetical protein [Nocardioides terrigena]
MQQRGSDALAVPSRIDVQRNHLGSQYCITIRRTPVHKTHEFPRVVVCHQQHVPRGVAVGLVDEDTHLTLL